MATAVAHVYLIYQEERRWSRSIPNRCRMPRATSSMATIRVQTRPVKPNVSAPRASSAGAVALWEGTLWEGTLSTWHGRT